VAEPSARTLRPDAAVRGLFLTFGFVIAAFYPFLALYLDGKGLTESDIGLVIATMAVARIVLNPLWGHLADATIGRRTSLQIGAFLSAVFGLVLAGVDGVVAIAVAGFFLAGAMVSTGPNIDAITLEHLGADRMSDYGKVRSWESFTYAIGCLTLGWLFQVAGIGWAMPAYALASLLVFAVSFSVPRDIPRHEAAMGGGRLGTVGARHASGGSSRRCSSSGRGSTPRGTSSRSRSRAKAVVRCSWASARPWAG
jgi:MFS family permease